MSRIRGQAGTGQRCLGFRVTFGVSPILRTHRKNSVGEIVYQLVQAGLPAQML